MKKSFNICFLFVWKSFNFQKNNFGAFKSLISIVDLKDILCVPHLCEESFLTTFYGLYFNKLHVNKQLHTILIRKLNNGKTGNTGLAFIL